MTFKHAVHLELPVLGDPLPFLSLSLLVLLPSVLPPTLLTFRLDAILLPAYRSSWFRHFEAAVSAPVIAHRF